MHMKDEFESFDELSASMREGDDYKIAFDDRDSDVSIVAPHGGKIEPGTSFIAKMIASDDFNFYAFEGVRRLKNSRLHITSHNFDEPKGLAIAEKAQIVLGIHGRMDGKNKDRIYLGGLHFNLVRDLEIELSIAGFLTQATDHPFPAKNMDNICNRGKTGKGAQLEISRSLRNRLTDENSSALLIKLSGAVRNAIFKQFI